MAADINNPPSSSASPGAAANAGTPPPNNPVGTPPPGGNTPPPNKPAEKPTLSSAFDELDKMVAEDGAKPGDLNGKPPEDGTKPGEGEDGKPPVTPPEKPQSGQPPVKAKTLREALDLSKKEASEWRSKYEALEAESKKPKPHPDEEKFKTERERLAKENEELRNEIRFADYTKSPEYKEKYETPFVNGYNTGRQKAASLKANAYGEPDAVTGERPKTARQGTKEDWDNFMEIGDDDKAAEFAHELWGSKAPLMLYHREQVQKLNMDRIGAIEEFRKNGNERLSKQQEAMDAQTKQLESAWKTENETAATKYPQWFKPVEGDTKGNELLQKGFDLADLAFSQDINKMPVEQRVRVWSAVRNKAAGFDRLAYQNKAQAKQIAELKAALAAYEDSENPPTTDRTKGGKPVEGLAAIDSQIDKMAAAN